MGVWSVIANIAGGLLAGYIFVMCSVRLLGILQQEGYSCRAFLKWYYRSRNIERKKASLLAIAIALLTAIVSVCFSFLGSEIANLISAIPFIGLAVLYCVSESRHALKVKEVPTPRLMRLTVVYTLVMVAVNIGLAFAMRAVALAINAPWYNLLRYVPFAIVPLLTPVILAGVCFVMKAYETPHTARFIKRAKAELDKSSVVKVGITGSFGKTSVKHFAATILSVRFKVIETPYSYNTPSGIARTVNEIGLDCNVFLAEMGARRTGEIAQLCDIVTPEYGILTGVCPQHTETFGSPEAIKAEKGVLVGRSRRCVLGRTVADLAREGDLVMGRDFDAEDVRLSLDGTRFTLRLPDGSFPVQVPVLGRHAAEDVALAAALCSLLGMTAEEIKAGIAEITPVAHRLERRNQGGVIILDDAYNANTAGAQNAVEVLKLAGGRKVVVTPGIVELGQLEEDINMQLGASLVGLDLVILVGETLVLEVRNGYLAAGGAEENLRIVPTLQDAQNILAKELGAGDCVLFLNDLPDIY